MKKTIIFTILMVVILLFGCAVVMKNPCNADTAYKTGLSDAKSNKKLASDYAEFCPGNKTAINSAYHQGYITAIFNERHAIAFNPNLAQTTSAGWQCIEALGNKDCGYHCMKSIKMVKCGTEPNDNCVADNSGNIKCGVNCRSDAGQLQCDQER